MRQRDVHRIPNCFDLRVRLVDLLPQSVVLGVERVALLREVVHHRAALAQVAFRVVEG